MKKLALFGILMFSLVLVSCPLDFSHLPELKVTIDKYEVCVGEPIELEAFMNKAYMQGEAKLIFFIENYPSKYEIVKGTNYEALTTEKFLCVLPEHVKGTEGCVKVKMYFSKVGEYIIKVNGFASLNKPDIKGVWNEEFYTYTILVK
jgi:hypothetical protein